MRTPEIAPLVQGVMAIIGLALMLGQYPKLERWAQLHAAEALMWQRPLPYFFAVPASRPAKHIIHRHPAAGPNQTARKFLPN